MASSMSGSVGASGGVGAGMSGAQLGHRNRESMQRKQSWFLPYVVLEVSKDSSAFSMY